LLPFMAAGFTLHQGIIRDADGKTVTADVANQAAADQKLQAGVFDALTHSMASCWHHHGVAVFNTWGVLVQASTQNTTT